MSKSALQIAAELHAIDTLEDGRVTNGQHFKTARRMLHEQLLEVLTKEAEEKAAKSTISAGGLASIDHHIRPIHVGVDVGKGFDFSGVGLYGASIPEIARRTASMLGANTKKVEVDVEIVASTTGGFKSATVTLPSGTPLVFWRMGNETNGQFVDVVANTFQEPVRAVVREAMTHARNEMESKFPATAGHAEKQLWSPWQGKVGMNGQNLPRVALVDVKLRNGNAIYGRRVDDLMWGWPVAECGSDIVAWREHAPQVAEQGANLPEGFVRWNGDGVHPVGMVEVSMILGGQLTTLPPVPAYVIDWSSKNILGYRQVYETRAN